MLVYGWGKPTERAYFYVKPEPNDNNATEEAFEAGTPAEHVSWIDSQINLENSIPTVRSGVVNGEGDGTVPLISSGAMCVDGWKRKLYNPAGIEVITQEIKHEPTAFDPRGGGNSGDHIDILGSTLLNEAVLKVAAGQGRARRLRIRG